MTALVIKTDSPVVAGLLQGHWTLADWEALPNDGNRYERAIRKPDLWYHDSDHAVLRGRSENRICGIMIVTMPF